LKQERHSSCAISVIYLSKLIFSFCSTGIWTQGLHLEPLHQAFFGLGFC
jgi:hypothetical protein